MKLTEGTRYRTRDGRITPPVERSTADPEFPWLTIVDGTRLTYTDDGRWRRGPSSHLDLVDPVKMVDLVNLDEMINLVEQAGMFNNTTPFGLLSAEDRQLLKDSPHGIEIYTDKGWIDCPNPVWASAITYRARRQPATARYVRYVELALGNQLKLVITSVGGRVTNVEWEE